MTTRDDTGIIKAGMAIIISSDEYSDYQFGQVYIAIKDFNYMEEAKKCYMEYMDAVYNKTREGTINFQNYENFENYLVKNGFLALCEYREIHTGDCEFFDDECFKWEKEWMKLNGISDIRELFPNMPNFIYERRSNNEH